MRRACIAFVAIGCFGRAAYAEDCKKAAGLDNAHQVGVFATAMYWDGTSAVCIAGCGATLANGDKVIYYLADGHETVTNGNLGVAATLKPDPAGPDSFKRVSTPQNCKKLFYRRFVFSGTPVPAPADAPTPSVVALGRVDVISRYLHPTQMVDTFHATSASSVASEAAQILGQIVVDRASQAAYVLLQNKLIAGMKCKDDEGNENPNTRFPATCHVVENLRLQDIAMAPNELRAALVQDVLTLIDPPPKPVPPVVAVPTGPLIPDPLTFLRDGIERRVVPLLARSADSITGQTAEVEIRNVVDNALRTIEKGGDDEYCKLTNKDRVLGAAALAFAACAAQAKNAQCSVMQLVPTFDEQCTTEEQKQNLTPAQLADAEAIAGHLFDAYTLQKDPTTANVQGRLVAVGEATFEIACMYASPGDGKAAGFTCVLDDTQHGTALSGPEKVALVRDLVLAALGGDGASLVSSAIRAVARVLPAAKDESKALRILASIAAYAATYSSNASPDDAHKQRTALLESLTTDMTVRTDRGGDVIFGFGGALRGVGGWREGFSTAGKHPIAFYGPLSLTLGLGLDWLFKDSTRGVHFELGVLDLGQYLTWNEGGQVATPDLGAAVSPSFTVAYFWGRQLPFFIGATIGYTPSYDFTSDGSKPKGSLDIGATLGIYVPLLDFD